MIDAAQLKRLMAQLDITHDVGELLPLAQVIWVVAHKNGADNEREECAKTCESMYSKGNYHPMLVNGSIHCSKAIRARGGKG